MIMRAGEDGRRRVRWAVVGLGHIAQAAVLPAFTHARGSAVLAGLVSSSTEKRARLGRRYGVEARYGYDRFEECLRNEDIDAVYLALPNDMHREYTERAAAAGVHVLCEKPMAVTEEDARAMIRAAETHDVRLMIAYRLHFEEATLRALEIARSGRIGEPRIFTSAFSMQVRPGNIRTRRERGGGPLLDIGIYCINAARAVFGAEPVEATALVERDREERFREVEEAVGAVLRFPGGRLASFVCSFGASSVAEYRILGERGDLRVEPAFHYQGALRHHLTAGGRTLTRTFPARDQFAPLLERFSEAIRGGGEVQPDGLEGLADVRVIEAIHRSAASGQPAVLEPMEGIKRPDPAQGVRKPPVREALTVDVEPASQ